jgi:YfiH family protein
MSTTRNAGVSTGPYESFNLAEHVGDAESAVNENRVLLRQALALPGEPCWLRQCHGTRVVNAADGGNSCADAAIATQTGQVCTVLTADCLPVLMCDRQGECVAAAHAGWRGLAAGILQATVDSMQRQGGDLLVWLGPAIGPTAFEVGEDVYQAFTRQDAAMQQAFTTTTPGHWHADLYRLARLILRTIGIEHIYGGDWCTYTDRQRFYSYRRDGVTGRMASLIWLV